MNKIYTDIEQSQKLIELGIDPKSADMYYPNRLDMPFKGAVPIEMKLGNPLLTQEIPAWSLSTLMNLLPSEFTEVGKYSITTYIIKIRKYKFTEDCDLYQIAYGNYKFYEDGSSSWKDMINTGEKEDLLDATFQMICWLKENEKI